MGYDPLHPILALIGDLAYIYDIKASNHFNFNSLQDFLEKNLRGHTLEGLVGVKEKMRED